MNIQPLIAFQTAWPSIHRNAVSPDKYYPAFGRDRLAFGSTVTLPPELKKRFKVYRPRGISGQFRQHSKTGLAEAWKSFPRHLQKALLAHGLQVAVAPLLSDIEFPVKEMLKHPKVSTRLAETRQGYAADSYTVNDLIQELKWDYPHHPTTRELIHLVEARGDTLQISDIDDELAVKAVLLQEFYDKGPVYVCGSGMICIPEAIKKPADAWNTVAHSSQAVTRMVRHELFHMLDEISTQQNGKAFSCHPDFRRMILEDREQAIQSGLWPKPDDFITDGPLANTGSEIGHYFSPNLHSNINPELQNEAFSEAFAEIGAAVLGGGAVNPELTLSIYPRASAWVRKNVLEQPLDSKRNVLHTLVSSIKQNLTKLCSSTGRKVQNQN